MTIEFRLLLPESVLLAATVALLVYSIHEGKRRDALLREVGRVTRVLTRQEYFFSISLNLLPRAVADFGEIDKKHSGGAIAFFLIVAHVRHR
jgi:hypothetical protein